MIDADELVETLTSRVREYARLRRIDVARGAETPRLAALLLQKYGEGVVDALRIALDSNRDVDALQTALDEEVEALLPSWKNSNRERWAARPADLSL